MGNAVAAILQQANPISTIKKDTDALGVLSGGGRDTSGLKGRIDERTTSAGVTGVDYADEGKRLNNNGLSLAGALFGGGVSGGSGTPESAPEMGDTTKEQNAAADQISRPKGGAATALGIRSRRRPSLSGSSTGSGLLTSDSRSLLGS